MQVDTHLGWRGVVLAVAALAAVAPASADRIPLPESPARGVRPEAFPSAPPRDTQPVPEEILARRDKLTLADVLEVALANDPQTRIAWRDARAKVDAVGSAKADYWPQLDGIVGVTRAQNAIQGGRFTSLLTTYGPGAALDWILLDFGERAGAVGSARREALAAVWAHGAAVQSTLLRTIEAFVSFVEAKANLVAATTSRDEAQTNLEAAERRRDAGVATIADVLQAKTALSRATLDVQTIAGSIGSRKGALATAMGLPANVPFDVAELPAEIAFAKPQETAEALIDRATASRPDLAAARERWKAAGEEIRAARGTWLPKLDLTGAYNRNYYEPALFASSATTWSVGLTLRIPVFDGLRAHYEIARARENEGLAAAEARSTEEDVISEVWASWYDLESAAQRVETSKDLLASASESVDVARGRYTEGVGTLLDLLSAQSAVASARAEGIGARADWLVAAARLLYATGGLTGIEAIPAAASQPSEGTP